MKLTKKQRREVWEKSNGICWYCGGMLGNKWHVDHFNAVFRNSFTKKMDRPENDKINNIVPACAPCNLFKSTFTIEEFRLEISYQADRARKYSVNFRTAERFGMIEIKNKPVIFWFEKSNKL